MQIVSTSQTMFGVFSGIIFMYVGGSVVVQLRCCVVGT